MKYIRGVWSGFASLYTTWATKQAKVTTGETVTPAPVRLYRMGVKL